MGWILEQNQRLSALLGKWSVANRQLFHTHFLPRLRTGLKDKTPPPKEKQLPTSTKPTNTNQQNQRILFLSEKTEFLPFRVQFIMHKLVQIFDSNIAPTATVFCHYLGF